MVEYAMLYLLFGCLAIVGSLANDSQKGKVHKVQNAVCFAAVFILLACRHQSMGIDLHWTAQREDIGYLPYFDWAVKTLYKSFADYMRSSSVYSYEAGFRVYVRLIARISSSRQFFIAVTAFISLFPIAVLFDRKSREPVLSWVIYLALSPFLLLYSGLRQGMTIGLAAFMFLLAEKKKWFLYLLTGLLAFSLHESAVLLILIFPLMYIKAGRILRLLSVAAFAVLFVFMKRIVSLMVEIFPQYGYMFSSKETGAYRFFLVLVIIYVICSMGTDGSAFQNAYMNLFYLACAFQLFGMVSNVAARAGFYFMNALCVLLPDVIENIKVKDNSALLKMGTAACFSLWGLYSIYVTRWAMAYPYYWFWERVA